MLKYDVIVIGAGAAGLYCSAVAGKRGRKVFVLEHTHKIGQKILVSGGGRCNFSNLNVSAENYISHNKDFVRSALASFKLESILFLLRKYNISYYEKEEGQLFCRQPAKAFLGALRKECKENGAVIRKGVRIGKIFKEDSFLGEGKSLVVATGGLSYKKLGATDLGLKIARQFGLKDVTL